MVDESRPVARWTVRSCGGGTFWKDALGNLLEIQHQGFHKKLFMTRFLTWDTTPKERRREAVARGWPLQPPTGEVEAGGRRAPSLRRVGAADATARLPGRAGARSLQRSTGAGS